MAKAYAQAQHILELLAANKVEPTPASYEFCYHYVTRTDPEMVAAVDELLKTGRPLGDEAISRLRRRYFGQDDSEEINRFAGQADIQMERLSQVIEAAGGDARNFMRSIGDAISDQKSGATTEPTTMINDIIRATAVMVEKTQKLEAQLAMSSQEVNVLRRDLEKARTESRTDALTGLPNRKAMRAYAEAQVERCGETRRPVSALFADIDHFKSFNDSWGHKVGDEVLRLVAQAIEQLTQGIGYAARYGGEEFVVLLPNMALGNAIEVAERIREFVANKSLKARNSSQTIGRVTLSLGAAQMRPAESIDSLFERADKALYRAKDAGRNCVMADGEEQSLSQVA